MRLNLTLTKTNDSVRLALPVLPHVAAFRVEGSTNLTSGFAPKTSGIISGFTFLDKVASEKEFFRLRITTVSSNDLLSAIVLNRLCYGPTPDEIERIKRIGPQAYLEEQLAPERIVERPELDAHTVLQEGWQYVTQTGPATSSDLYLNSADGGPTLIDDVKLVKGTIAGQGENLIRNGDFEAPLNLNDWEFGNDFRRSQIVSSKVHAGSGALQIMAEYANMRQNVIRYKINPPLAPYETYTLSYWYYRVTNRANLFQVWLNDSHPSYGIFSSPDDALSLNTRIYNRLALPEDLVAWHARRAVLARRQLLEVLVQFVENHFATAITKNADFFGLVYNSGAMIYRASTFAETEELNRWRAALLQPECTFHDLLRISIESPAMIMYLDTIFSRGGPGRIANENYARELMELHTMGSDNGYDQEDVTTMAEAWTGWTVDIVEPTDALNPFAPRATNQITGFDEDALRSYLGVWKFKFMPDWHQTREKVLFRGKKFPERFGPRHAGKSYELRLPERGGRLGLQDGYEVAAHLANLPFTQEFICVKLCQLFVHDDFSIGYDFTTPQLSAEARLVKACMEAWESSQPKGRIRDILRVIFNSELFRSSNTAFHKLKTPFEFTLSAVRALWSEAGGASNAELDPYAFGPALERMGRMVLFDHDEPDGVTEAVVPMISVSALAERVRFVQALLSPEGPNRPTDARNNNIHPVSLIQKNLPAAQWTDSQAVADYLVETIYFGHGRATLQPVRELAVEFLNQSDDGRAVSAFGHLNISSEAYNIRVRGLVALLLGLYTFNQQ